MVKRVVNITNNQDDARKWDVHQAISMSHEERQKISRILKERVYGKKSPDVKAWHQK